MTYTATIHIMPRAEILDPQGKATQLGLHNLGLDQIHDVRIGKRIELS
ncbi:MAG: phosphoribosylformylglycinamidine synthase subunit PurS, partial [Bacteroidota bacterium]